MTSLRAKSKKKKFLIKECGGPFLNRICFTGRTGEIQEGPGTSSLGQSHRKVLELEASPKFFLALQKGLGSGSRPHVEATGISWGNGCKCFLAWCWKTVRASPQPFKPLQTLFPNETRPKVTTTIKHMHFPLPLSLFLNVIVLPEEARRAPRGAITPWSRRQVGVLWVSL